MFQQVNLRKREEKRDIRVKEIKRHLTFQMGKTKIVSKDSHLGDRTVFLRQGSVYYKNLDNSYVWVKGGACDLGSIH